MQRPPPLQLLPAFEAASRLLSFSKAAAELHVTTAAISQQIRQLEGHLGLPLFLRLTRRVELTDAGRQFAEVVTRMLHLYRQGHADLLHHHTRPVLRLSTTPLVAQELLIPRLAAFQAQHPGVSLRLDARMDFVDFEREPIDAAIRVGKGPWPGLQAQHLCRCTAAIVAAPELLARHPVRHIDDLAVHTLIHPREAPLDWHAAARFLGRDELPRRSDLVLDSDLSALKAAEQGLGLALCLLPASPRVQARLIPPDKLVCVLPPVPLPDPAWFVSRLHSGKEALLAEVFAWIRAEVGEDG
jgi:LysR family glycine cleavage system transcriptional activator